MNVDSVAQVISVMQEVPEDLRAAMSACGDNVAMKWSGVANVIEATIEEGCMNLRTQYCLKMEDGGE